MTNRVLFGKHPSSGVIQFSVSKAGFDVLTANPMQMAFSSDYVCPNLVVSGTVVAGPTSGYAPSPTLVPGAHMTTTAVYYGRTISPVPFVTAIASAAAWACPTVDLASQLGNLGGQWHTPIWEYPPDLSGRTAQTDGTYGPTEVHFATTADGRSDQGDITFASARFTYQAFTDRVEFYTINYFNINIKCVVLEP